MKKCCICGISIIMILVLLCGCKSLNHEVETEYLGVNCELISLTEIKVTWGSEDLKVNQWKIYQAQTESYESIFYENLDFQEIAMVSGEEHSYTVPVEEGHYYCFKVESDGSNPIYSGDAYEFTGPSPMVWYEPDEVELDHICLSFTMINCGMGADGYDIYRADVNNGQVSDYEKIASRSMEDRWYDDTFVEARKTYSYYCQSYVEYEGETIYCQSGDRYEVTAANFRGKYEVSHVSLEGSNSTDLIVGLFSDPDNANTLFKSQRYASGSYQEFYLLKEYSRSLDQPDWKEIPKEGVVLKPGEIIYLKFDASDEEYNDRKQILEDELHDLDIAYNNYYWYYAMDIDLKEKTGGSGLDDDAYS